MSKEQTLLGTVEDVEGFTVNVLVSEEASLGLSFVDGYGYRVGQIGSFVRIPLGYDEIFGVISQVGASADPNPDGQEPTPQNRWVRIQLIGESDGSGFFTRGISRYPTVGDEVHIVTEESLSTIYGRPDSPEYLEVGSVIGSETIPSLIDINKLVTRHSAIVGSTGAGKSTTVAGLLYQIQSADDFISPRVLVLDIHGEYSNSMRDIASVFTINPDDQKKEKPLHIPFWALNYDELVSVSFGSLSNESDRRGVMERLVDKKQTAFKNQDIDHLSVNEINADTPVPFSIHKLWFELHKLVISTHYDSSNQGLDTVAYETDEDGEKVDAGDAMEVRPPKTIPHGRSSEANMSRSTLNIRRQLNALASRLRDNRYDFLFEPGDWQPDTDGVPEKDLDALLQQWLEPEKGVSILDLSGIPPSVLDTLIGALLRIVYDSLFWARNTPEGGRERPLLIVLEEAHSYLNNPSSSSAAQVVQKIAKEGRKYGIGAMLVSQRPTEIDSTILSQCGTMFAMRLDNSKDRSKITSTLTSSLEGVLDMLPVLRNGEAIIVGQAVQFPTRTMIQAPPEKFQPDSEDPTVYSPFRPGGWDQERLESEYGEVLELWRRQETTSTREIQFEDKDDD